MENKITHKQAERLFISAPIAKKVWSMMWSRKECHYQDFRDKGYNATTVTKALERMIDLGVIERVQKGIYRVTDKVVKG